MGLILTCVVERSNNITISNVFDTFVACGCTKTHTTDTMSGVLWLATIKWNIPWQVLIPTAEPNYTIETSEGSQAKVHVFYWGWTCPQYLFFFHWQKQNRVLLCSRTDSETVNMTAFVRILGGCGISLRKVYLSFIIAACFIEVAIIACFSTSWLRINCVFGSILVWFNISRDVSMSFKFTLDTNDHA